MTYRILSLSLALACLVSASALVQGQEKDKAKATLKLGSNPPGPFHPYNVTGPWGEGRLDARNKDQDVRGLYHCPVSENNLDPTVLIFVKEIEVKPELGELLQKLDNAIEKNPAARLHVTVTFFSEKLTEVVGGDAKTDDLRDELAVKIRKIALDFKLKNIILCLDGRADVARYLPDEAAGVTVVGYKKFNVEFVEAVKEADLAGKIKTIMEDVKTKLGAKRE